MSQEQKEAEKLVGQVLANTYRLEQLLVSGGMGAVFRSRHVRTGGVCAIKVLHSRSAANQEIAERFQDEARIISALRHPSIVQVTDLDQDASGLAFIVMELLEGEDLQDRIERDGKIPLLEALEITREISSALHAAHSKGVIHRDLKPRNIFLAREEHDGQSVVTAKVIDFGVSKIPRPADRATRDLLVLGTPRYMAPEGALGKNSEIDGRSDQWSVAVILYRMLSGRLPFDQENIIDLFKQVVNDEPTPIEQLCPGLPRHIAETIKRALRKKKEDRFPTMLEFIEGLEPPKKRKRAQAAARPQELSPWRLVVFGLAGAALAGLLLVPLVRKDQAGRKRGLQATDLLAQADIDLSEERWDDATAHADQVLHLKGQPESVRAAAEMTKKRADNGQKAQQVAQRLLAAVSSKDYDGALAINSEMPPSIGFRITAQQYNDVLSKVVLGLHLQQAEAARNSGNCAEVQSHIKQMLKLSPENPDALQARWRPCASYAGVTAPGPKRIAGYPPVRAEDNSGPELPGDYPGGRTGLADIDRFLRDAQLEQLRGHYWRAATLAHVAAMVSVRSLTAWRIVGVAACNLKDPSLLAIAAEHMDLGAKEFVRENCQAAGYKVNF
jgi:hypothetical protein